MTLRPAPHLPAHWVAAVALCLTTLAAGAACADEQAGAGPVSPGWGTLSIPGTPAGLLGVVGLDQNVSRTRLVLEVIRRAYESPDGDAARTREALRDHLSLLGDFDRQVQAAGGAPIVLSRDRIRASDTRRQLESLLGWLGYRFRTSNGPVIELTTEQAPAERRRRLLLAGIDVGDLAERLAAGNDATIDVPRFEVPLPMAPEVWRALDMGGDAPAPLYFSLLGERRAALLYAGLCALDRETLRALGSMPALLQRLHDESSAAFAAFGGSLRLRDGRVIVPGDEGALRIWESLAGAPASDPIRFVPAVFERDRGRLAYFFETVTALDPPRQRFALASTESHPRRRLEQVESLYSVFQSFDQGWQPAARPFTRRPVDPARWLGTIRVDENGGWVGPRARKLWDRVFAGSDLSSDAGHEIEDASDAEAIDGGWLAGRIFLAPAAQQQRRFDATLFSQRVFAGAAAPDVHLLVALRGFLRFPTLSLTLERLSLVDAPLHAQAARRAAALTAIVDTSRRAVAVAQFQSALFLVERCVRAGAIDRGRVRDLVAGLVAIAPDDDGRYLGGVAKWVGMSWMPAIAAEDLDTEAGLVAAVAGARHDHSASGHSVPREAPSLVWEGERYELNLVTPEVRRIDRIREQQAGNRLEQVLDLARLTRDLPERPAAAGPNALADRLGQLAAGLRMAPAVAGIGASSLPDPAGTLTEVREELSRAAGRRPLESSVRDRLAWLADVLLTDTLVSIAYAVVLGDPESAVVRSGHVAARHDPGLTVGPGELDLPTAWEITRSIQGGGKGWSARGSLLLLDIGLAPLAVRRLASDMAPPVGGPGVPGPVLASLARTHALWNAFELDNASRDEISATLRHGRAKLASARDNIEALGMALERAGVEPIRQHQAAWAAQHEPSEVDRLLSLADLVALGVDAPEGAFEMPRAWATEALVRSGCVCLEPARVPGPLERGRPAIGLLGAHVTDIALRLMEISSDLGLPAGLTRALLAGAVYDFAFDAAPLHDDDWLGLVRGADAISRDRIEDYVAMLTFDGPLEAVAARPEPLP